MKKSTQELMPEVGRLIREGKTVVLPVRGNSMRPFIQNGNDCVELHPLPPVLRKGDVVLAWTDDRRYVLHRIIAIDGEKVTLMGDGNLQGVEHCTTDGVKAKATHVVDCKGRRRELYTPWRTMAARLWQKLRIVRRYLLKIYKITHRIS